MYRRVLVWLKSFGGNKPPFQLLWAVSLLILILLGAVAYIVLPEHFSLYRYLVALFAVNSIFLFLLTEDSPISRSVLIVFIFTIELLVTIFFVLAVIDSRNTGTDALGIADFIRLLG